MAGLVRPIDGTRKKERKKKEKYCQFVHATR